MRGHESRKKRSALAHPDRAYADRRDALGAQEDTKAIGAVQLESNQPGVLKVSWDAWNAPTETPVDYQVNRARADQNYPTGAENNA